MPNSTTKAVGNPITALSYNELRSDVLDSTTGHGHTGGTDGKLVSAAFSAATPAASAPGDTGVVGVDPGAAHGDHRHPREALGGVPAASAVGDTGFAGSATTAARSDHRHAREAFGSPSAVAYASSAGSASTVSRSDHVHQLALTSQAAALSSNVTLTNASTYYDGPSLSLAAGTWLVTGAVTIGGAAAGTAYTAKLWDGTTVAASGSQTAYGTNNQAISVSAIVTLGGATILKISATASATGASMIADAGAGNTASHLRAVRIA